MATTITYTRTKTKEDLQQILELQKTNLPDKSKIKTQQKEGFVTVKHQLGDLQLMHQRCPHFVAKHQNNIIAYALSMHPDFRNQIEILQPMFDQIELFHPKEDYMVMGQICINQAYRKQGIFRKLYQHMCRELQEDYCYIITEIDEKNQRSLQAHLAIGFENIHQFLHQNTQWILVRLATEI
ncbi:MAG: GNAT family N-acetyltransferase [Flavobacteriaceae bacterium]|nr:GNAT family N-acetyltransferase [Flavobacteriaceae bacterium]